MTLLHKFINEIITELQHKENKHKIENYILDPCINYLIEKIQPYFIATTILILVLVVSISFIIYLLLIK